MCVCRRIFSRKLWNVQCSISRNEFPMTGYLHIIKHSKIFLEKKINGGNKVNLTCIKNTHSQKYVDRILL